MFERLIAGALVLGLGLAGAAWLVGMREPAPDASVVTQPRDLVKPTVGAGAGMDQNEVDDDPEDPSPRDEVPHKRGKRDRG